MINILEKSKELFSYTFSFAAIFFFDLDLFLERITITHKSRDLNRNSSRNKNETMFGSGYKNCPEFGVLGGVILKLDIL
jgi:hypothetical protein